MITELLSAALFIALGNLPLVFAVRARRRWVRVLLALLASFCLLMIAVLILFAAVGDGSHDNIPVATMALLCAINSVVALVYAFIPIKPDVGAR